MKPSLHTGTLWRVQPNGDEFHVVPVDDIRPHRLDDKCPCQPVHAASHHVVVIHAAWDRREVLESLK